MFASTGLQRPVARAGGVLVTTAPGAGAGRIWRPGSGKMRRGASSQQRSSSHKAVQASAERPRRWTQGPNDTQLRDVNRDRLMGLLTERAAKTLLFYFSELNPTLMQWLEYYLKENPIPKEGSWEEVSGEAFLRKLMSMPIEETRWNFYGREQMYSKSTPLGVDPRSIAQRIMEIRSQIAKEWVEELKQVSEENALLMRETVLSAFSMGSLPVADPAQGKDGVHPELLHPDFE